MNDKEQRPIVRQTDRRFTLFTVDRRVLETHKRIEKYLASLLEADPVLPQVDGCLLRVPDKALSEMKKEKLHLKRIYIVYLAVKICSRSQEKDQGPDGSWSWVQS